LATWARVLWSQVFFPGQSADPSRVRNWAVLLLLVVPGALLYPSLSFHLFEPDEGRYAQIPREMLLRGEWIVPYLQGKPYLDKPPLLYWLVMGCYGLFGIADWTARLVPALAVHGCVLLTYVIGRRSLGERPAFWGALLLALAPGFVSVGRLLVLDGVLAFFVWLSLLAALEAVRGPRLRWGWWLTAAMASALGVLSKGPVAVFLVIPPLWLYRRLTESRANLGGRAALAFALVVLSVNLPWYLAVSVREPSFPRYFFWEHNVVRFLDPFDHQQPIWFYGPIVLGGLLPGTLLVISFCRFLLADDEAARRRRPPELGFFLLSGGWCVLFFTLSGSKLPTYVLPAFPCLALALGASLAGSQWERTRWPMGIATTAFVLLAAGHVVAVPWYAWHRSPMGRPADVVQHCSDPATPVVCYPRPCDSVAFYLGRDDLQTYRSKETNNMICAMQHRPKTVVLFTHRHSLEALRPVLPPDLRITHEARLFGSARFGPAGECQMAVVEQRDRPRPGG
jgi:4-amino-4-deoxy-L-arabinose transferase-like glycosyltransferase